jgi:hypothetical protein
VTREQKWWVAFNDLLHTYGWGSLDETGRFHHRFPPRVYTAKIFCDPIDDGLGNNTVGALVTTP